MDAADGNALAGIPSLDELTERIMVLLSESFGVESEILPDSHLTDELGLDSLDLISAGTELEDLFDIRVADDDFEGIQTVAEVAALVHDRLTRSPAGPAA